MNLKRAKQEQIEKVRQSEPVPFHPQPEANFVCPAIQNPTRLKCLLAPSFKFVSHAELLEFDDNQYKKRRVDTHDQVISLLAETAPTEQDKDLGGKLNQLKKKRQKPLPDSLEFLAKQLPVDSSLPYNLLSEAVETE